MEKKTLSWTKVMDRPICETPVFTVYSQHELPPRDSDVAEGDYVAIEAPDWVIVMPVIDEDFIMVRQWRHGEQKVTIEFPGGVCDPNEDAIITAKRELFEETGCRAETLKCLGTLSTNPALFRNHVHIFLAEGLSLTGTQHTDADEVLTYVRVPIREAIEQFASGESTHAFTGTALMLYLREKHKM